MGRCLSRPTRKSSVGDGTYKVGTTEFQHDELTPHSQPGQRYGGTPRNGTPSGNILHRSFDQHSFNNKPSPAHQQLINGEFIAKQKSHSLNSDNNLRGSPSIGPSSRDLPLVIALYPYENKTKGDLTMRKGEVMTLLDRSNMDWWYVKNHKGKTGYVPRNFVALQKTIESEEWFSGRIPRNQAERLVLCNDLPLGTFLIRERECDVLEYALTIRDYDDGLRLPCVKHYKIKALDNGAGFYITTRVKFPSLPELVSYYSGRTDGLCHVLTRPAPRFAPVRPDLCYETQNSWEIPRRELQLTHKIDDGNFGEVWYGKWRDVVEVAIKKMKPGTMSSEAFLGEAQIMKHCNHPNLVKLYAVCTMEEPFFIVTEFMQGGSLLKYLRDDQNILNIKEMIDICSQIANGMKYLEERKLVHRDLAARNVLVGEKISGIPTVKVADFGLARKLMEEDIYEAKMGAKFPIKWTAPEAATTGNFTVKSDVWSYGILLFEIFTRGQQPYSGMHNREVVEQVSIGYRIPCPKTCPDQIYYDVQLRCWDKEPEKRPTFDHLYSYFDDFYVASQPNYTPS